MFKSRNHFFFRRDLPEMRKRTSALLELWNYSEVEIKCYLTAFDYFRLHPELYDGATMTEELNDLTELNLDAMLHDYLYIELMASVSWKYQRLADKLYRKECLRRGKSSWNTGYAYFMLTIKTPFFIAYCYLIGRRFTEENKAELDRIFQYLN